MNRTIDNLSSGTTPGRPEESSSRSRLGLWIAVIALLALSVVAVFAILAVMAVAVQVRQAREAQIRGELDQLAAALQAYKLKYGEFPPSEPQAAERHVRRAYFRSVELPLEFDDRSKALVLWLSRISENPTNPFTDNRKSVFFDFDPKRVDEKQLTFRPKSLSSPYVYDLQAVEFEIRSAGLDDVLNTDDDLVVTGR